MKKIEVILVDENNQELGKAEKIEAHKKGWLHRAFSIFVFNSEGKLLLQQRAGEKYHSGGLWSNTVCSHPMPGETYDQAVHRRLQEEMGFDCELEQAFCFVYKAEFDNGLIENEYDCVFLGRYDGEIQVNPDEVSDYKWVEVDELRQDVKENPESYSFWLGIALRKITSEQIEKIVRQKD